MILEIRGFLPLAYSCFVNIGLFRVFEVVNIRRGPKNALTPECFTLGCLSILRASANVNDRKKVINAIIA